MSWWCDECKVYHADIGRGYTILTKPVCPRAEWVRQEKARAWDRLVAFLSAGTGKPYTEIMREVESLRGTADAARSRAEGRR